MSTDCPFCLENRLLKTEIICENERAFAVEPLGFSGHYLIIPKEHVEVITDLADTWWADFKQIALSIPRMPASYNVALNYGVPAGQTVAHLHFWIVPRVDDKPSSGKGLARFVKDEDAAL